MRQFFLIAIMSFGIIYSQDKNWSLGTAYSLNKGQWETGLFQPLRYGLSDTRDIATQHYIAVIIQNITVKQVLWSWDPSSMKTMQCNSEQITILLESYRVPDRQAKNYRCTVLYILVGLTNYHRELK